tara:strand:- start:374 stop:754 length:381 start_codon:yes stop_codon:yes gene_type:complete
MIFGIGTDIVEIQRIKKIDSLDKFAKKILSINELNFFQNLANSKRVYYLAKQFAGKEAIAKAIGIGISKDSNFAEIEILRNKNGKPYFMPIGKLKAYIDDLGITKTHVSLSDEKEYAIAFAILEKK